MKSSRRRTRGGGNGFTDTDLREWLDEDEDEAESLEEVLETSDDAIADKYAQSQLRVVRESRDFTLDYLGQALKRESFIINVSPDYQRRQRWSAKKRSQLIESFLLNIPVPPVFLYEHEYNAYEVVDGRQRLDTIRDFLSNGFALTGLEYWPELNDKRFQQLPMIIQKGLVRRSLPAVILLAETRKPEKDVFDVRTVLFNRLNTGGEKLNPQELRNALYPGRFNKMLIDTARSDLFTATWGIPKRTAEEEHRIPDDLAANTLYRTMADCELVLRFFAIREILTAGSRGPMRILLDSAMKRHQSDSEVQVEHWRAEYVDTLGQLYEVFDGKPFRIPGIPRPSRTLYDALMVASFLYPVPDMQSAKQAIQNSLNAALDTKETYEIIVGRRGNTADTIKRRIAVAQAILSGQLK